LEGCSSTVADYTLAYVVLVENEDPILVGHWRAQKQVPR
jgi:hypothetical protein